jgi:hypothetical protein
VSTKLLGSEKDNVRNLGYETYLTRNFVIYKTCSIIRIVQFKWLQWTGREFEIVIQENLTEFILGSLIQNGHMEELEGGRVALRWLIG